MFFAQRHHQRHAAERVERGADHAAVQPAVGVVAHQLGPHVQAHAHVGGVQRLDLQAQQLVEADALLPQLGHRIVELLLFGSAAPHQGVARDHAPDATAALGFGALFGTGIT